MCQHTSSYHSRLEASVRNLSLGCLEQLETFVFGKYEDDSTVQERHGGGANYIGFIDVVGQVISHGATTTGCGYAIRFLFRPKGIHEDGNRYVKDDR
jgi:hypothetical protein